MVIRSARTSDLPHIMDVIESARSRMRAEGNHGQWDGYPTEQTILDDINGGTFYVFVDDPEAHELQSSSPLDTQKPNPGHLDLAEEQAPLEPSESQVHGCFSLAAGPDPEYSDLDGAWIDETPYGVIHRVATDNTFSHAMAQILDFAHEQGFYHIRIDTNGNNLTMQAVLERLGFVYCGELLRGREGPWYAYEISPTILVAVGV